MLFRIVHLYSGLSHAHPPPILPSCMMVTFSSKTELEVFSRGNRKVHEKQWKKIGMGKFVSPFPWLHMKLEEVHDVLSSTTLFLL